MEGEDMASIALVVNLSTTERNGNLVREMFLRNQSWIERDMLRQACITYGT